MAEKTSRKYTPVWEMIKKNGKCELTTSIEDSPTIIEGVKQEKTRDKNKPKGMLLRITTHTHVKEEKVMVRILFTLVEEVSIRNL